jgi:hypothetical protein
MSDRLRVVMVLDNYYAPDRRVEYECRLLGEAGMLVRVVAWDRRSRAANHGLGRDHLSRHVVGGVEVIRVNEAAPSLGGAATFRAMLRFGWAVWRNRATLIADADVLVVHDVFLLPVVRFLSWVTGHLFIYDAHEEYAAMEGDRYPQWILRGVTNVESWLAHASEMVVIPGTIRADRWRKAGFDEVLILSNVGEPRGRPPRVDIEWDIAYVSGTLGPSRRPDLLLEVARRRPDLRMLLAGVGQGAAEVQAEAATLANVEFREWVDDPEALLARGRVVFYGLDPNDPYSDKACPNTLYQALKVRRPLIFFCGGEAEALVERYRIGIQCRASADAIIEAFESVRGTDSWQFDEALRTLASEGDTGKYVDTVRRAAEKGRATLLR